MTVQQFAASSLPRLHPVTQATNSAADALPAAEAAERALLEQAEAFRRQGALDAAIRLGEQAVASAEARGDARMTAIAQTSLANYHRYVPNSLTAIHLLNRAEHYFRTVASPSLARVLTFKGMVLSDLGDHSRALDLYREALGVFDLHRAEADPIQEATCYGSIGIACTQLGELEQAEDAYRKSLQLYGSVRNAEGMGYLYNNLAILRVRSIQAIPSAERNSVAAATLARDLFEFIEHGLQLNERSIHSAHLGALLRGTRGDGLRALGRAEEALPDLEHSLAAYEQMNSPRGQADVAADLGAALLELGRDDEALSRLHAGLEVAIAHELKDYQRRLRKQLSDGYEKRGDFREALDHYRTYHRLERELHDRDTQKKLQQLALRDEIQQALQEAREQSRRSEQLSEQNEALRRQTMELDRIAHVDALTGLANRRRFEEVTAALPTPLPAGRAVAVLDIDFFKRINDTWSHAMGDRVLQAVGALLRAHCRDQDLVARIGGEEFVVLFDEIAPGQATAACERVRTAIESHGWDTLQPGMPVTVSIGLALADDRSPLTELLQLADERLYAAKRDGRNRVVSA